MAVKGNPDQYLKRRNLMWYARVSIPPKLRTVMGEGPLEKSLGTRDKVEANKRKHLVVDGMKKEFDAVRIAMNTGVTLPQLRQARKAESIREALLDARSRGDHPQAELIDSMAVEMAHGMEALSGMGGPPDPSGEDEEMDAKQEARSYAAKKFYESVTAPAPENGRSLPPLMKGGDTLNQLAEKWLVDSKGTPNTKAGHKRSLREFLAFHRRGDVLPGTVGRPHALAFIDEPGGLKNRPKPLSAKSIETKIASLYTFWEWMYGKMHIPQGDNPWSRHKINPDNHKTTRPPREPYTSEELLLILAGNARVHNWEVSDYLTDLSVLGLYSGARIEELCSMPIRQIQRIDDAFVMRTVRGDVKTNASVRVIAFTAKSACEVLERRTANADENGMLFPELSVGGYDKKHSQSAVKAYGRFRRALGVSDGRDFHSFRRNVAGILIKAGVRMEDRAPFLGHKSNMIDKDVYDAALDPKLAIQTSRKIVYPPEIEVAALAQARRFDAVGTGVCKEGRLTP